MNGEEIEEEGNTYAFVGDILGTGINYVLVNNQYLIDMDTIENAIEDENENEEEGEEEGDEEYIQNRMTDDDEEDEEDEEEDDEEAFDMGTQVNILRQLLTGFPRRMTRSQKSERKSRKKLMDQQEKQRETFQNTELARSIREASGYNFEATLATAGGRPIRKKRYTPQQRLLYKRAKLNHMIPDSMTSHVTTIESSIFCSQFSQNGEYYLIASQDAMIRLYREESIDMLHHINVDIDLYKKEHHIQTKRQPSRRPRRRHIELNEPDESIFEMDDVKMYLRRSIKEEHHHENEYPYRVKSSSFGYNLLPSQQFHAREIGYSCIDVDMNRDASAIIYSSWSPFVQYISTHADVAVGDDVAYREDLDYSSMEHIDHFPCRLTNDDFHFCAFSIQFSGDGHGILAGGSDHCCYFYDLQAQMCTHRFLAHASDVNSVEFATHDSNVFMSGSDDKLIKIWDTRRLNNDDPQPVGVLKGHANGITKVSSKGDGIYFLSNGKDQAIKLWDIRMLKQDDMDNVNVDNQVDYRFTVPNASMLTQYIDHDQSILTLRSHIVQRTLIRAYFSPLMTTGQRYVYTGDAGGGVYIYDLLTGEAVKTLKGHKDIVRDVTWHPYKPYLLSSSWDGSICMWSPTK